jgi:hypothetical protein
MLNVLFTAFNRPDLLKQSLAPFSNYASESCFFLHVDGPRAEYSQDIQLIEENLKVFLDFCHSSKPVRFEVFAQPSNLGCMLGMQSAISWFFTLVDSGMIIEDDILVHPDAILNTNFLLERHEHDRKIGSISLYAEKNLSPKELIVWRKKSWPHIWGWATWRDRWEVYEQHVQPIVNIRDRMKLTQHLGFNRTKSALRLFDRHSDSKNTWDTQWLYTHCKNYWKTVSPSRTLTSNLGFDERATHTRSQAAGINSIDLSQANHRHIFT